MSQLRANSFPDLVCASTPPPTEHQYDDSALEGVAANIKLLLKLIQDHKDACDKKKKNDGRRMLRVATMMTILDNVRDRIQKCQSFGNKRSEAELRRNPIPRDKKHVGSGEPVAVDDEKERLRRELSASLAASKSLQIMCSSLGKEKEIMSAELSKKVHELSETEELISSLKAQNERLLQKIQDCASKHNEKKCGGGESQVVVALQERNKALSEQLLRSLDGYRSMKKKHKVEQEENLMMHSTMDEMGAKFGMSLERVRSLKERILSSFSGSDDQLPVDFREEMVGLESMFECFQMLAEKHDKKQGECVQHKGEISAIKPSVLA